MKAALCLLTMALLMGSIMPGEQSMEPTPYPLSLDAGDVDISITDDHTAIYIDRHLMAATTECSRSMTPMFGCGNTLILEKLGPYDEVAIGDIVVYWDGPRLIIHQIVGRAGGCYSLKGLNNDIEDPGCVARDRMAHRLVAVLMTDGYVEGDRA